MLRSIRTIRNIPRLKDISFILLKHGFYQVGSQLGAPFRLRLRGMFRLPSANAPLTQAARLRLAFQELGPTFIKLGQLIASRPDLFPSVLVQEFTKLEDRVNPIPFADVQAILDRELGTEATARFRRIDPVPLASASMAQVHRATLIDGTEVVLKVQKPDLEKIVERDMEILSLVAEGLAGAEELQAFDPRGIVAEAKRALQRELNFNFERNALERVRANFENDPVLRVPRTYGELSTPRLLVMEFLDGISVRKHRAAPEESKRLARECVRILFEMIFRDGYFHGDPHPGNILVLSDGRLGWIDFGSMGLFTQEMRGRLVRLLRALIARDYVRVARQVLKFGRPLGEISFFDFSQDLASRLDPFFGLSLKEIDVGDLFQTVMDLARDHRISIAPGLVLMTRCLVLMEGLAKQLDPDLDTMEVLAPLATRYVRDRMRPDRVAEEAVDKVAELASTFWEYPQHLAEILRQLSQGRLNMHTEVAGVEGLNARLEHSSNTVSHAVIFASILISSSMVMSLDVGPSVGGAPLIAVVGYVVAGLMGLWTLLRILKE